MKNKKQIIFIHGGSAFKNSEDFYEYLKIKILDPFKNTKKWTDTLEIDLGDDYEIFKPNMPFSLGADYKAWKIWFEKYFEFIISDNLILIGHSLGGTFLLKYLSENSFPRKVIQLHLVAPAVIDEDGEIEKLSSFEFDILRIYKINNICAEIHLWHSEDDPVVSIINSKIIKENISRAELHIFKDKKHFNELEFPEILEVIKKVK